MNKFSFIRVLFFCLIATSSFRSFGQGKSYFKMQAQFYRNQKIDFGAGALFSGGMYKKNVVIGFGGGFLHFGGPSPYVPAFVEIGVYPRHRKITPIFGLQFGYGFTSGAGEIGEDGRSLTKGLFFNPHIGASFATGKQRLNVILGATIMQSNIKAGQSKETYSHELFTMGVSYIISQQQK
ncbi:MAG TPA: hypothetical protein VD996_02685 [Chitinophagaceae bacterium]|nr:hypothetical protein [Chitinophagaceae bacterium]